MMDVSDWIALSVLIYVAVAGSTAFYVLGIRRASVFEPVSQYLFFVSLFTLPLPIRCIFTLEPEGNVTPFLASLAPWLPLSVVLTALALPAFCLAYYSKFTNRLAKIMPRVVEPRRERSLLAFCVLAAFSLWLIALLTQDLGGILAFVLLGYKSTEETFGKGYLAIGIPWFFVAALLLGYRYARHRRGIDLFLFATALAANLALHVLTANRSMLMYIAVVLLTFVHVAIKRLSLRLLAPLAVAGFLLLNVMGLVRGSGYEDLADLVERTSASSEQTSESKNLFYTLTIGEFVVPFETLPQMARTVGISSAPWFGWSYLRSPIYLIPGAIFPDRPLPLSNWYMQEFYGGGYGLNEGRQFFFLSEAYLNFGAIGPLLIALVWGVGWGVLQKWQLIHRGDPAVAVVYALTVGYMYRCIAGDAMQLVAGLTQQSLVAAVVGLLIAGVAFRSGRRQGAPR